MSLQIFNNYFENCCDSRQIFCDIFVTQADQATNSIPTDDANMAIQCNVAMKVITFEPMQVVPLGGPIVN